MLISEMSGSDRGETAQNDPNQLDIEEQGGDTE